MIKTVNIPVSKFSAKEVVRLIHHHAEGRNLHGVFFNEDGMLKGTLEIRTSERESEPIVIERPSKIKQDASSRYYCVYKDGNKWTYKFNNKKLSPKPFLGKTYETEIAAAHAYDEHRYSVEGDVSKLNFPENFINKAVK